MNIRTGVRCIVVSVLCLGGYACFTLANAFDLAEVSTPEVAPSLPANPCDTVLSSSEQRLYRLLMEYRGSRGLPSIPLSPNLSYVAKTHVRDLQAHPPAGKCNFHSWSGDGPWTACCYTDDHARAKCMWNKPRELTKYPGNGFEIASWSSASNSPEEALSGWKGSPLHNAVIVNSGMWARVKWKAVGVGIYGSYAVVWFGEESDPCPE
jgi:hypothetical protein